MTTSTAEHATTKHLTQEEIVALALRAKTDVAAIDELMATLVIETEKARRADALQREIDRLEQRLALVLHKLFGRSSEKLDPNQLRLFMEALPVTVAPAVEAPATETVTFKRTVKGHGRDTFPAHLPREEIRLDPPESERHCAVCSKDFTRIGEDQSERAHHIPGIVLIRRYIRGIWACQRGCGSTASAAMPPALVPKSRFEPSVAIQSALAKFADHCPTERQCAQYARMGLHLAPTSLADTVTALAALHQPTVAQMEAEVVAESYVHVDDTPVTAIIETSADAKEKAKLKGLTPKQKHPITARMWVYVTITGKSIFKFTEDRTRDGPNGPAQVLKNFQGCFIGDAYAGYHKLSRTAGIKHAACWAHVRRKYSDALLSDKRLAARAIDIINRLFRLESAAKTRRAADPSFGDEQLLALRQRRSAKVIAKLVSHVNAARPQVLPQGPMNTAIGYLLNNLEHLKTFLADPKVPVDNNAAERGLRCIALGRKNYLQFGSLDGGGTAAVMYSLIGSCKSLDINPYAYLTDTTNTLLLHRDTPRAELTPWAWAAARAKKAAAELAAPPPTT